MHIVVQQYYTEVPGNNKKMMKMIIYRETACSPRRRRARARSLGWMVTRFAWMAARFVSSNSETRYASDASWRAMTADDWKRRSVCWAITHQQVESYKQRHETYLEILSNFTNKTLEGKLADEQLRRLLVPTNLTKSDGSRPETMRLLHTTSGGRWVRLASLRLGGELLTGRLACIERSG